MPSPLDLCILIELWRQFILYEWKYTDRFFPLLPIIFPRLSLNQTPDQVFIISGPNRRYKSRRVSFSRTCEVWSEPRHHTRVRSKSLIVMPEMAAAWRERSEYLRQTSTSRMPAIGVIYPPPEVRSIFPYVCNVFVVIQ